MTITTASRAAKEHDCPRCGQTVLAGLDADRCATTAVIDTDPITPTQEVGEWEAGRPTYFYDPMTRRIDYRDRGSMNPTVNIPVHPTHTCPQEEPLW